MHTSQLWSGGVYSQSGGMADTNAAIPRVPTELMSGTRLPMGRPVCLRMMSCSSSFVTMFCAQAILSSSLSNITS